MSPEYEANVDDVTEFPWLGVTLQPGERVVTQHPEAENHPLLKKVTKSKTAKAEEK